MEEEIYVTEKIRELISISWQAIKHRRVLKFDFRSNNGNDGPREIKPYMIYINDKRQIKVVGLPRNLWNSPPGDKDPRQYLLDKISLDTIEILPEVFDDPGVPGSIVVKTKKVRVICRFLYDNEDLQEVMKEWVKVAGLHLT